MSSITPLHEKISEVVTANGDAFNAIAGPKSAVPGLSQDAVDGLQAQFEALRRGESSRQQEPPALRHRMIGVRGEVEHHQFEV